MATFINGVTDYIPQFQPYKPNLQLIDNTLAVKQSQYDQAWAHVNSIKEGILNAQLSNPNNIADRDKFFEAAERSIKKISTVDLTKGQNLTIADRIFDPMVNNEFFIKDVAYTKNWQKEYQRGLDSRECTDPKKCPGFYNPESIEALQYQMDDFKKASKEETMSFGSPRYIADPGVGKRLTDLVKEIAPDASVQMVGDKWLVTTKMGARVEGELSNMLSTIVGQDPAIIEYMQNKAYVTRRRYEKNAGIDKKSADEQYNNQYIGILDKQLISKKKQVTDTILTIGEQIKNLKAKLGPITEANAKYPAAQQIQQLEQYLELYKQGEDNIDSQFENLQRLKENPSNNQIDGLIAQSLLSSTIDNFAKSYAKLKEEVKYDINPEYMAKLKHSYDLNKQKIAHDNALKQLDYKNKLDGSNDPSKDQITAEPIGQGASSTKEINPSTYVRDYALKMNTQRTANQKQFILQVLNTLTPEQRKLAKLEGYTYHDIDKLNFNNPQDVKKIQTLYGTIEGKIKAGAIDLSLNGAQGLVGMQETIAKQQEAIKLALSTFDKNRKVVMGNMNAQPAFQELLAKDPENLRRYFKIEKDHEGNNMLVPKAESEIPEEFRKYTTVTSYGGNPSTISGEVAEYKLFKQAVASAQQDASKKGLINYPQIGSLDNTPGSTEYFESTGEFGISIPFSTSNTSPHVLDAKEAITTIVSASRNSGASIEIQIGDNATLSTENQKRTILEYINGLFNEPNKSKTDRGFVINSFVKQPSMNKDGEFDATVNTYTIYLDPESVTKMTTDLAEKKSPALTANLAEGIKITIPKSMDVTKQNNVFSDKDNVDPIKFLLDNGQSIPYRSRAIDGTEIGFNMRQGNGEVLVQFTEDGIAPPESITRIPKGLAESTIFTGAISEVNKMIDVINQNARKPKQE